MASVGPVSTNTISQSNLIFALIFIAFLVFITMRGKLTQYLQALIGTNTAAQSSNSNSNNGQPASGSGSGTGLPLGNSLAAGVVNAIDQNTGSDLLGRAATNLLQAPQTFTNMFRNSEGVSGLGLSLP